MGKQRLDQVGPPLTAEPYRQPPKNFNITNYMLLHQGGQTQIIQVSTEGWAEPKPSLRKERKNLTYHRFCENLIPGQAVVAHTFNPSTQKAEDWHGVIPV